MMKIVTIVLFLLFVSGCNEKNIENGLNISQLESRVSVQEKLYLEELEYIFQDYDLILYNFQSIRSSNFFYFIERLGFFNIDDYRKKVIPRFEEKGWYLVKSNSYGELYCNSNKQAIGITFPSNTKELEDVHIGYYTYQFYKKLSITLDYNSNGKSSNCSNKSLIESQI